MNLITDKWIDIIREDGSADTIAPHQIVERDNPPVDFDGGLPTIDGGYILFLIHLLQTVAPPENERDWKTQFEDPPTVDQLIERLSSVSYAFDADGEGYRYMQAPPESEIRENLHDKMQENLEKGKASGLPKLLAGSYSSNKAGQTVFGIKNLDPDPIPLKHVMAMITWGHASGKLKQFCGSPAPLRKNGCVNAIVMGSTLWETVWANVLSEDDFYEHVTSRPAGDEDVEDFEFPWMNADYHPRSAQHGRQDFNPLYSLWFMPAWTWVDINEDGDVKDLAAVKTGKGNAKDGWKHPLSGFDTGRSKANPLRLSDDLNVKGWVKIRFPEKDGDAVMPAVMKRFVEKGARRVPQAIRDVDTVWVLSSVTEGIAKAVHNVDKRMPFLLCAEQLAEDSLRGMARKMQAYAGTAIKAWDKALRHSNMTTGKGISFTKKTNLWDTLEASYLNVLEKYRDKVSESGLPDEDVKKDLMQAWIEEVVDPLVLDAFDSHLVYDKMAVKKYQYSDKTKMSLKSPVVEKSWLEYNLNEAKKESL